MKKIEVYDYDAQKLLEAARKCDVTIADIIEWLVESHLDDVIDE